MRKPGTPVSTAAVPPAVRAERPGWREPRLWIGLAVVAVCVVLGARVMAGADETVRVWAADDRLAPGTPVGPADLVEQRVRFADDADLGRYLLVDDGVEVLDGKVLARDIGAGELLPRAALTEAGGSSLVEVPLSVQLDDLPATVREGSVVDVWVTAQAAGNATGEPSEPARLVLDDVRVVSLPGVRDGLAPQASRQVIVGASDDAPAALAKAIGAISSGRVVVTGVVAG